MLNKAQLMDVPGGPGVVGAIQAGNGILIDTSTGTTSVDPTKVVTQVVAGVGVRIDPPEGVGTVTISSTTTQDIPAGSITVFAQASAPTGWTKVTSTDNAAIRVVSGSGGGTGGANPFTNSFTTYTPIGSFSSANLVLSGNVQPASVSTNQIASHTHNYEARECAPVGFNQAPGGNIARCSQGTSASGSGQGHTHGFNGQVQGNAGFAGTATNQFTVRYVDAILCSKN
jgi:hypothetical protein